LWYTTEWPTIPIRRNTGLNRLKTCIKSRSSLRVQAIAKRAVMR
jgi:hypothetical protein